MADAVMINHTKTDARVLARIAFSIGYGADIDAARSLVIGLANSHPQVQEVSGCPVTCLNTSSVDFLLMVWCADSAAAWIVKCDLLEAIKKGFDAGGIEIPYSYQNIILKQNPKEADIRK